MNTGNGEMGMILEGLEKYQKALRELGKILKEWEKLEGAPGMNVERLRLLQKRAKKVIEAVPEGPMKEKLVLWLKESESTLSKAQEEARFSFGRELEKALRREGMQLSGRIPKFFVGPYGLEVDFERGKARITFGYDSVRDNLPLQPEAIVKSLVRTRKEIERPFEPEKSVNLVFEAYLRVLKILGKPVGERVPLMDVLLQLVFMLQGPRFRSDPKKENFRGLSRAQFAMMLYAIRTRGARARGKYGLFLTTSTFDATRKRENFLWIPDNMRGEGTTFSFISFKELNQEKGGTLL